MDYKELFMCSIASFENDNYFSRSNDMKITLNWKGLWKYVENSSSTFSPGRHRHDNEQACEDELKEIDEKKKLNRDLT